MNHVIRLVYRGKEENLGGNMCMQQAECVHPFREKLQEEVGPAAGEGGALGNLHMETSGESGNWPMALQRWVYPALLSLFVFM